MTMPTYEAAITDFINSILNKQSEFYKSFRSFLSEVTDHAFLNSISQLILKFACPGVPDIYQGCEKWDFSFVDPDNRRPVEYELFESSLNDFNSKDQSSLENLWTDRNNGHIKT